MDQQPIEQQPQFESVLRRYEALPKEVPRVVRLVRALEKGLDQPMTSELMRVLGQIDWVREMEGKCIDAERLNQMNVEQLEALAKKMDGKTLRDRLEAYRIVHKQDLITAINQVDPEKIKESDLLAAIRAFGDLISSSLGLNDQKELFELLQQKVDNSLGEGRVAGFIWDCTGRQEILSGVGVPKRLNTADGVEYEPVERLGAGAVGITIIARDVYMGDEVVIKLPKGEGPDYAEHLDELESEADRYRALNRFREENPDKELQVCPYMLDMVKNSEGKDCLVITKAKGENASGINWEKNGNEERLLFLRQLALSVHAIHLATGRSMADFHPNNVYWDGERVTLIDFNLMGFDSTATGDRLMNYLKTDMRLVENYLVRVFGGKPNFTENIDHKTFETIADKKLRGRARELYNLIETDVGVGMASEDGLEEIVNVIGNLLLLEPIYFEKSLQVRRFRELQHFWNLLPMNDEEKGKVFEHLEPFVKAFSKLPLNKDFMEQLLSLCGKDTQTFTSVLEYIGDETVQNIMRTTTRYGTNSVVGIKQGQNWIVGRLSNISHGISSGFYFEAESSLLLPLKSVMHSGELRGIYEDNQGNIVTRNIEVSLAGARGQIWLIS